VLPSGKTHGARRLVQVICIEFELELICPTGAVREIMSTLSHENISVFRKAESAVSSRHPASL
jgi:hypothetical protein